MGLPTLPLPENPLGLVGPPPGRGLAIFFFLPFGTNYRVFFDVKNDPQKVEKCPPDPPPGVGYPGWVPSLKIFGSNRCAEELPKQPIKKMSVCSSEGHLHLINGQQTSNGRKLSNGVEWIANGCHRCMLSDYSDPFPISILFRDAKI